MNTAAVHQAASLLLRYPDHDWPHRLRLVTTHLTASGDPATRHLLAFCHHAAPLPPLRAARDYVAVFDRSRRRTLHLTYYTDGDTRRRGASLARLKETYRAHGWLPDPAELPDFLPMMLEFAARCPRPGSRLLLDHRAAVDALRTGLERHGTPYTHVLDAVRATLPGRRAAAVPATVTPPGTELVGLEPFPTHRTREDTRP
ncbi:nitrate reductase molybdenum cofactor assembly chaperone [Streptantibioticus cattleyicolor]|uniref:Nitrate reductase delta chain NarJ3 n=1 Tax=Streptantibioticus cattleyicolor (strain ATCC 35852 / DSM 46488 / JCM 4925 / NBRC 14057 / NRRL 8057) TaxID=1003195 RepID=F8JKM0_STREN|nr:nitrate reductase molybdenum cofactor assembly chaperone [Streptantibioticus cattleyicolor]AEW98490.1 nitrate reductase delta chain NarJ3 [Streptantibioticus cattleyicolor NRRL 8057 = DSM 46488]CCB72454.1 Nitrate reductase delta chain NarJ3 [Streptantibioticus cattleyicolor NRRL 8057 = DSM 46488]